MTPAQLEARRKGGLAFKAKYGQGAYRILGARGGRPRAITINDLPQLRGDERHGLGTPGKNIKEVGRPSGMKTLIRALELRRRQPGTAAV